jgi:hypothetical protein
LKSAAIRVRLGDKYGRAIAPLAGSAARWFNPHMGSTRRLHAGTPVALLLALVLCAWTGESRANTGVPLLSNLVAYSWLLMVPIIGVEAYVLRKRLSLSLGRATGVASAANFTSALVGIIVVVLLALVGAMESAGAMGDVTVLVGLVPMYFLTVWVETRVAAPMLSAVAREQVRAVLALANRFSYAMLAIVAITRFAKNALLQDQVIW